MLQERHCHNKCKIHENISISSLCVINTNERTQHIMSIGCSVESFLGFFFLLVANVLG